MNEVRTNFTGLRTLQRQLKELNTMEAHVGLFADNAGRVAKENRIAHNPSLGYVHEFTPVKGGVRSWLRMPLLTRLGPVIKSKGAGWFNTLHKQGAKRTLGLLGAVGEDVIQEAFATGGWGQWPTLSRETIRRKGSSAILIESAQMRKAVASRVV